MLNLVIGVELSITEGVLALVLRSLWVERVQRLDDLLVFLFSGELLLVDAAHICLVHDEIIFVLDVIGDLFLDDLVLLSLFLNNQTMVNYEGGVLTPFLAAGLLDILFFEVVNI